MTDANGNAARYFVDRHLSEGRGAKAAFLEGERTLTYGELARQSDAMVGLLAQHAIRREQRVAMLLLDSIEFPVIFWGAIKAGVVPVPLNTLLSRDYYEFILQDSRARALFVSEALLETVAPILGRLADLEQVFVVGPAPSPARPARRSFWRRSAQPTTRADGHYDFASELARATPGTMVETSPDDCAFWLYSSGSTGWPKGVRHVHESLEATAATYGAKVLAIREDDTVYSAAKLFFAYGLGNSMTFPMSVGATTALLPARPTPDSVFATFARYRPTIFFGVPTLYAALLAAAGGTRPAGLEQLRLCASAGEALPEDIGKRWKALTGADILDGVGSTEMLHIFLSNAPGDVVYGTSGIAVPGYDLRLVDEANEEVATGEVGELLVKGPSASDGYWNQRAKSRSTFEGHWTRTGDKYERRPDGRYVYCGRTDDMFKVGGIWVSPFEVEQALISHPKVLEAAVIAKEDDEHLLKPKAFVVLKPGVTSGDLGDELKAHVQAAVGKWKYPRWIEFVAELPKTATGKIQRFKLRELEDRAQ